ncbi:MAG: hypothetical protein Q7T57_07025, partial [Dehalococcoidales bacterium]|nr:hypothetical protein [Dehalococcoidales bacterium]
MMASSFLDTLTDSAKLEEIGRFTFTPSLAEAATTSGSENKKTAATVPADQALIIARSAAAPNTIFAFNYLRITAPQYFALTAAL